MQSIIKKLIILFCFITFSNLYSKDLDKVSLQLSWFNQFQFAGYYIAKEKGFYKDVGLDVDIKNYDFNIDVPTEVSNGNSNFGIGRETLLLDKSEGKDVVSLYATFQASPLVLISLKNSNIESIKDFENKKIMATPGDATEVSIKAMITSKNIDFKKMIFLKHSHNVMDLVNKKTDIMSAYISKAPYSLDKKILNIIYFILKIMVLICIVIFFLLIPMRLKIMNKELLILKMPHYEDGSMLFLILMKRQN